MEILYWIGSLLRYLVDNDLISPIISFAGIIVSALVLKATIKALNEQNRPFISFSIEPVKKIGNLHIIIRNTGNRTAENVKIETEPKLISYCDRARKISSIISKDGKMLLSGIAPNQTIKSFFDSALYRYRNNKEEPQDKLSLTISYNYNKREFVDKIIIDFSYLKNASQINSPEDIEPNIKKIADSLVDINKKFRKKRFSS